MDLVFKPALKFWQAGSYHCWPNTEFWPLDCKNNDVQSKYCLTSNFLSKMRCNEKFLPNKASVVSKMHLFWFGLISSTALPKGSKSGLYGVHCCWLIAFRECFPRWFCSVSLDCSALIWLYTVWCGDADGTVGSQVAWHQMPASFPITKLTMVDEFVCKWGVSRNSHFCWGIAEVPHHTNRAASWSVIDKLQ